jgi:hypothetical protein
MSRLEQAPPSFAAALYCAAGFMVVAPFLYESQRILPLRGSDLDWRFGAEGFLLTALTTPLLGIALGMLVAWGRRTPGALRLISAFSILFGVVFALLLAAFVRDLGASLPGVPVQVLPVVKATAGRTIAGASLAVITALILGIGGWRSASAGGRAAA